MRIALVTPYSWTYEGGVNRHVEALAVELMQRDHEVRVFAPWDPPDRKSRLLHRGADAHRRPMPEYLTPLARTVGFDANGSMSVLCPFPAGVTGLRRGLEQGNFDLVHVHEPPAPTISWDACSFRGAPVVGTFHAYSTRPVPNQIANVLGAQRKFNQLHERIAVSDAAAWTGRRWFGGEYTVIPNGVDLSAAATIGAAARASEPGEELRVLYIGRSDARKGLPVLIRAFEALIEHVPARLELVGPSREDLERLVADPEAGSRITAHGRLPRAELWEQLAAADVLSAPSLEGESFGMVLIEAFAATTPVVASAIAGYSDVVSDGVDGLLVPPGDPQRLAEALQSLYHDPARRARMAAAARRSAARYAWPVVASRIEAVYDRALAAPNPHGRRETASRAIGLVPADGSPLRAALRLPSLDPPEQQLGSRRRLARRAGVLTLAALSTVMAVIAMRRIGVHNGVGDVISSAIDFSPIWVVASIGLMCGSMFLRAGSWWAGLRSALPEHQLRRRDVTSATMVGVMMSATVPARAGEPARAMVMARRLGRFRESFPVVLGTLVSQTLLNLLALTLLGAIIVASTDLFHTGTERFFVVTFAPAIVLIAVLVAPAIARGTGSGRTWRVIEMIRVALIKVRRGLVVFRDPRFGPLAALLQLVAWAVQVAALYALAVAMGIDSQTGIAGAAAVLFAVNVTAVVPVTPSNVGIFQAATAAVLTSGFGVDHESALAYGVVLQIVEFGTAVGLGLPALLREGITWSDMRVRALGAAPVRLSPVPSAVGPPAR